MKRFRTIVADPPWDYGADHGRWATSPDGSTMKRKAMDYPPLTTDQIAALGVQNLADSNCALFLWTTNRHLPRAFYVLSNWGFEYRQTLVWHKTGNPSPFGGAVAPIHSEFLLVGVVGRPSLGRLPSSVIAAPKPVAEHSRKPDVFLDLIEEVAPDPRLELFARRARFGWEYAGNESLSTIEIEGLAA